MKTGTKKFLRGILPLPESLLACWETTTGIPQGMWSITAIRGRGRAAKNAVDDALSNGWIVLNRDGAITLSVAGRTALERAIARPSVFDDDYPTERTEVRGTPEQWRGAFEDAQDLTAPEATTVLGGRSPYAVLGVARTIDLEAMKTAARKLFAKWHPDHVGGNADTFRLVYAAYTILKERLEAAAPVADEVEEVIEPLFNARNEGILPVEPTPKLTAVQLAKFAGIDESLVGADGCLLPPTPVPPTNAEPSFYDDGLLEM
jgi:DnaJ domain